jgi:hypothetical protein
VQGSAENERLNGGIRKADAPAMPAISRPAQS